MDSLSLETAIRNVADIRKLGSTASQMYYLKQEFYSEYNPFFYHYSKTMFSEAEQYQKKERANLNRDLRACAPPNMPKLKPFYAPMLRVFESDLFVKLLRVVFERYSKRSRFASESLVQRALFLMGMALNEQKSALNDKRQFGFLDLAVKEDLMMFLGKINDKQTNNTYSDLLWWIQQVRF